jgi:pimeloyl-ACP methyl ester carboxylesterase
VISFISIGIKTTHNKFYVDIGNCVGIGDKVWTLAMNTESSNTPILLLHGFGAAIGFWVLNLDAFAQDRPLYAIDLLGYGKSSRPKFSKEAEIVEDQYIESLEKWRQKMKIEKFFCLGHSFGGYLSTAYAIKYPERIEHLILGDPVSTDFVTEFHFLISNLEKKQRQLTNPQNEY